MLASVETQRGWNVVVIRFKAAFLLCCLGLLLLGSMAQVSSGATGAVSLDSSLGASACDTQTYLSADVPLDIGPYSAATSFLTVTNGSTIASIEVTGLNFTAEDSRYLEVNLRAPSYNQISLFRKACTTGYNWVPANTGFNLLDSAPQPIGAVCPPNQGTYSPRSYLNILHGLPSSGVWALTVINRDALHPARLHGWGLRISSGSSCVTATPTGIPRSTATPTATPATPVPTPTCGLGRNYNLAESGGAALTQGDTLVPGSQCTFCAAGISLPFTYYFYGQPYTSANAIMNGTLQFNDSNTDPNQECLPYIYLGAAIVPYWDGLSGSTNYGSGLGIYTSTSGTVPNRVFNIEWRACRWVDGLCGGLVNFEVRLYEGQNRFDIVYGYVTGSGQGVSVGVQSGYGGAHQFISYSCYANFRSLDQELQLSFSQPECIVPTPPPATPTATPTPCTAGVFSDVPSDSTFHPYVTCLAGRGIVSGYGDCTFRPNSSITRGQIAKIVSGAAGYSEVPVGQIFEDVGPSHTFYAWIQRMAYRGYMGGYPCGQRAEEPCLPPEDRPYFRPQLDATRGQLSKIVANAAGYSDPPGGQLFEDVPFTNTFHAEIQRLASRGIMGGYVCGGAGEQCVPPGNLPYFRPFNNVTRGQASKIVANTFFPNCVTP